MTSRQIAGAAQYLGLVPLVWLCGRRVVGKFDVAWWWLGLAFAVSWAADEVGRRKLLPVDVVSLVYPVSQASLVGAVFLERRGAMLFTALLTVMGVVAALVSAPNGKDVLLRSVANAAVCGIVWDRPALGWLRWSMLAYFGLGLLAWYGFAQHPTVMGWWLNQGIRVVGIVVFCYASVHPSPRLRIA